MAMHCYIISPFSDKPPRASAELCCTPVLFQLHWLPVRFRSLYNILCHTLKVLNETAPVYLRDLIEKYIPVKMLRSESYSLLRVPRSHTTMYGERSFRASTPRMWDELPNHIKLAASKDIFARFLKPIYLNWRIYNIKPVYYVSSEYVLIMF